MSRTPLVIGAALVLAAAVVLVVILSRGGDESASSPASPIGDGLQKPVVPPPVAREGQGASVTVTDVPRKPDGESPASDVSKNYKVGEVPVRDHRSGDQKPMDLPPNIHPAEGRMLPSQLTAAISAEVRAVMMQCASSLPREGRGANPRLEGQIDIGIKNGTMSVTRSTVQLRELDNVGADAVKQCVESRSVGLKAAAAGEADLDSYSIRLSFAIP